MLADAEWAARQRVVLWAYIVQSAVVLVVGLANDTWSHVLVDMLVVLAPGVLARFLRTRLTRSVLTSLGILTGSAMMVHFTGGLIESHFAFFVMLPMVALYHDWRPFAVSIFYVAFTHAVVGVISPMSMYNHPDAWAAPVKWGIVHAAYVLALALVMIVHWNFAEKPRLALKQALGDLESTQTQLVQAQKLEAIGSLAAGVAHEINTPIQFVGDNLRFLADASADVARLLSLCVDVRTHYGDDQSVMRVLSPLFDLADEIDAEFIQAELPKAVEDSLDGVERVSEIVKAMKGFSHPSEDVLPHDVNRLIGDTVVVARNEWKFVAELDLDLDSDLGLTPLSPGPFNQVILNLIVNAAHAVEAHHRPEGGMGQIQISTRRLDDGTSISVSDDGVGMTADVLERIFDPFFTTKEVGRGTGQGLSIARSVIADLGGTVEVSSEVGVGTTFMVHLPSAEEREVA